MAIKVMMINDTMPDPAELSLHMSLSTAKDDLKVSFRTVEEFGMKPKWDSPEMKFSYRGGAGRYTVHYWIEIS